MAICSRGRSPLEQTFYKKTNFLNISLKKQELEVATNLRFVVAICG